ncbi:MAG: OmpH family outer membrane protein [Minwuia sp.]|nr:OmpH family outer membrane protein [Minwuia sp.]
MRAIWLATILITVMTLGGVDAVRAQPLPTAVIATIDSQQILRESKAAISIAGQIKGYMDSLQQLIQAEDNALKARQDELRQQAAILSPEAIDQRQSELQKSYTDAQRMVQDRRQSIGRTQQQAVEVLKGQILGIIEELERERGFNLVLDRNTISWNSGALDITGEIITRLNQRLPSVKVGRPEGF